MTNEELMDALDGLHAYDGGATDSGIHDERLRQRCRHMIDSMDPDESRIVLSRGVRDLYLSDEAISEGYGWEDVLDFLKWIDNGLEI